MTNYIDEDGQKHELPGHEQSFTIRALKSDVILKIHKDDARWWLEKLGDMEDDAIEMVALHQTVAAVDALARIRSLMGDIAEQMEEN